MLIKSLMNINKIFQIPIINEEQKIIGLHHWEQVTSSSERENYMIVMAGGMGKRLMPHTEHCPKPLIEVAGKPMLEHIIDQAKTDGFKNFIFSVNYLGHMIEDYFGSIPRGKDIVRNFPKEDPITEPITAVAYDANIQIPAIMAAYRTPSFKDR